MVTWVILALVLSLRIKCSWRQLVTIRLKVKVSLNFNMNNTLL